MSERKIPVYVQIDGKDRMIDALDETQALELIALHRLQPTYGRRQHLKAVHVVERLTGLIHLERDGYCFTQHLPNVGRKVFALVGTPGSEEEKV